MEHIQKKQRIETPIQPRLPFVKEELTDYLSGYWLDRLPIHYKYDYENSTLTSYDCRNSIRFELEETEYGLNCYGPGEG